MRLESVPRPLCRVTSVLSGCGLTRLAISRPVMRSFTPSVSPNVCLLTVIVSPTPTRAACRIPAHRELHSIVKTDGTVVGRFVVAEQSHSRCEAEQFTQRASGLEWVERLLHLIVDDECELRRRNTAVCRLHFATRKCIEYVAVGEVELRLVLERNVVGRTVVTNERQVGWNASFAV